MFQSLTIAVLLTAGLLIAVWGCKSSRSGYESAPYSIALKESDYELRDYPELAIVETAMQEEENRENSGFRKLFAYISGKNKGSESIAMTTPVFISGDRDKMAFVLPADFSSARIPIPLDSSLSIKNVPPGRFAVLRFNGGRSSTKELEKLLQLNKWLDGKNLKSNSLPIYAYFDPPWTPGFLRRNEVMLRTIEPVQNLQ